MLVQAFVSELAVEAFDEGVLRWFAGLDEAKLYLPLLCPEEHRLAGELRAVITDDHRRQAAAVAKLIKEASRLLSRDRGRDKLADHLA